ncbi:MAG: SDR family oxidoreductase [Bacilli bacterium]|jgi:short-subunit dehydrogenase
MKPFVLITGASSGIGRKTADIFASHSFPLFLIARNQDKLLQAKKEICSSYPSLPVEVFSVDLLEDKGPQSVYEKTLQLPLPVGVLINCAGIGNGEDFATSCFPKQEEVICLDCIALASLCRLFLPSMLERGEGTILNVASTAGFSPVPPRPVYSASKAFVLSFSQSLYEDYRKRGVKTIAILPGATKTDFFAHSGYQLDGKKMIPPEKVAKAIYSSYLHPRAVVSVGAKAKILGVLSRLLPRSLVRKAAAFGGKQK